MLVCVCKTLAIVGDMLQDHSQLRTADAIGDKSYTPNWKTADFWVSG